MPLTIPPPRASGFTNTTGVPLYWCEYGPASAPPLLVLHGGPGAHHDYLLPQYLELAAGRRLVLYDQRGGGKSRSDSLEPITWRTHADDLAKVVDELRLEPLDVVGYSWGALLALLYSVEAQQSGFRAPRLLVLVSPAPLTKRYREQLEAEFARRQSSAAMVKERDELARSGLRERDAEAYRQRAFELSVAGYFRDPALSTELTPFRVMGRVQESVWRSLGDFDVIAQLETIRAIPSLVLHGWYDPIPVDSSYSCARALGARFVVLEASGHVPHVEQSETLFTTIRYFLAEFDVPSHAEKT
ncbi:MAG TPA: alpha/beta hydrolase [Gemmatimonadaceae bacterium]|nr:alpha/beta hydrolase [Gemmatimonadaceae bacterium]